MYRQRLPHALLLILTLCCLSGCVYLRLLAFKNQLRDFDQHVVVDQSGGLTLSFPEPVLLDQDFVFFTDTPPSQTQRVSQDPLVEDWHWPFEKKAPAGDDTPVAIVFHTRYQDGLLTQIQFDPKLLQALPPECIVELFRSLGKAKINKLRKSASATIDRESVPGVALPSLEQIHGVMGPPTSQKISKRRQTSRYQFNFYHPVSHAISGQFQIAFTADTESTSEPIARFELTAKAR